MYYAQLGMHIDAADWADLHREEEDQKLREAVWKGFWDSSTDFESVVSLDQFLEAESEEDYQRIGQALVKFFRDDLEENGL